MRRFFCTFMKNYKVTSVPNLHNSKCDKMLNSTSKRTEEE